MIERELVRPGAGTSTLEPSVTTGITVYGCGPDEAELFCALAPRYGARVTIVDEPVSEGNISAAFGSRCVSVGHRARVSNRTLFALRTAGVEYVSTRSVGQDHLDVRYAVRLGLTVGTVAYSPDSVADYTLMLVLMGVRHAAATLRRTDAHDYRLDRRGRELRDLTVGIVGTGRIGTAVIDRLAGFGCRVLAHDPHTTADVEYVALEDLLRHSDVVTLHAPLTAHSHHLLDRRRIAQMKPGALLVNTARGALVDTAALVDALESGRLGGAALDVVEGEEGVFYADRREQPVGSDLLQRLHRLPNVVVSPHTAYYTDHALHDVVENSLVNCTSHVRRSTR
jgi:D-specific alpha-keto acid dehydrogenase